MAKGEAALARVGQAWAFAGIMGWGAVLSLLPLMDLPTFLRYFWVWAHPPGCALLLVAATAFAVDVAVCQEAPLRRLAPLGLCVGLICGGGVVASTVPWDLHIHALLPIYVVNFAIAARTVVWRRTPATVAATVVAWYLLSVFVGNLSGQHGGQGMFSGAIT